MTMPEVCRECGAQISEGENICEYCGTAVPKKQNRFCRKCGTQNSEGALFCRKCGTVTGTHAVPNTSEHSAPAQRPNPTRIQAVPESAPALRRKSPLAAIIASVLVLAVLIGAITAGINQCGGETITGSPKADKHCIFRKRTIGKGNGSDRIAGKSRCGCR